MIGNIRNHSAHLKVPFILFCAVLTYIAIIGTKSTDIGHHWDERLTIRPLKNSAETGLLLPRWYKYPSIIYDISLVAAASKVIGDLDSLGKEPDKIVKYLVSSSFKLYLRKVFFLLSICSGLAIYFFVRTLSGSAWTGFFAASALITSFEFIYHARWIATDSILAFFVSCSLASQYQLLVSEGNRAKHFWVILSSVLAGLCIGTKYTGGIVLVPLLLAIALAPKPHPQRRHTILLAIASILIAGLTFVVTTPGSILEPVRFLSDVLSEIKHYSRGHGGYTVDAGLDHLSKMLTYLFMVVPSRNAAVAMIASLCTFVGVVFLISTRPKIALWFLSLPVLYILYMSSQRVMIVRNYLLLFPFLAVLTSLGLFALYNVAKTKHPLQIFVLGFSIFFLIYNLSIVTSSSLSIIYKSAPPPKTALEKHIASSPETKFYLSPACFDMLELGSISRYTNLTDQIEVADSFVFLTTEADRRLLRANVPGRYRTVWSPIEEVNWDYYPTWIGNRRILEVSLTDRELKGLIEQVINAKDTSSMELPEDFYSSADGAPFLIETASDANTVAWLRFVDAQRTFYGHPYHWLSKGVLSLIIDIKPQKGQALELLWGAKNDHRTATLVVNGKQLALKAGEYKGFRWLRIPLPEFPTAKQYKITIKPDQTPVAFIAEVRLTATKADLGRPDLKIPAYKVSSSTH